jgi:hypothetical protein
MYAVIAAAALFISIVLSDLLQDKSSEIPKHALFGLICTLLIFVLSYNDLEMVGWGLLVVPIFSLFISFLIVSLRGTKNKGSSNTKYKTNYNNCNSSTPQEHNCPAPVTIPTPSSTPSGSSCAPATVSLPASLPSSDKPSTPPYSITPSTGC